MAGVTLLEKNILKFIHNRIALLNSCEKNFETIFNIMFSLEESIAAEENDGFCIKKHTFGDIKKRIIHLSGVLDSILPKSGKYIGIEMENCTEWIVTFWAILRSGNKPYLINTRHSKTLSASLIKTLEIENIISLVKGSQEANYYTVSELEEMSASTDFTGNFADEFAISTSATTLNQVICYYSGKKVCEQLLNSGDIVKQCPAIADAYHGEIKHLAFLPFYHIFGLSAVYFWFSFFGAVMVFLNSYAPEAILKTCRKHEVTHIFAVPMFWHSVEDSLLKELAKKDEKKQQKFQKGLNFCTKLQNISPTFGRFIAFRLLSEVTDSLFGPSLRFAISGGSYIKTSTLKLLNGLGCFLHNGFGMSEVGITSVEQRSKPKFTNLNAIGQPFGSVEYKISEKSTLLIKGASLCDSISINGVKHDMPEWFDTKDIVEIKDGDYYIKGRLSDTVIGENGENINPDLTEQEFILPDAVRFSVLGLNIEGSETLSMVVQISKYLPADRVSKLISEVYKTNEKFPLTVAIKAFYLTQDDIMPPNAVKVGRKYLKSQIENGNIKLISFKDAHSLNQINNETEHKLFTEVRDIIIETIGIEKESLTADSHLIFDLGITSFQYLSVIMALEEKFKINEFMQADNPCYTINEICKQIERYL